MSTERIVVMMPFGGESRESERRAILHFMRLRHLLGHPEVRAATGVTYDVHAVSLQAGNIQVQAVEQMLQADVAICLLTEENVNVAFELAVRSLRDVPVLIVRAESTRLIPIYLAQQAYITDDVPAEVQQYIDVMAQQNFPTLDWQDEVDAGLRQGIDAHDSDLRQNLESALVQRSRNRSERSEIKTLMLRYAAEEVVSDLVKRGLYERWTTYFPSSTVEIRFKQALDGGGYCAEDMDGPARVIDFNAPFARLYDFDERLRDDLTIGVLLGRLEPFLEPENFPEFIDDQTHLTERIVNRGGFAVAHVPLRLTDRHPDSGMRGRVFHPCLVGKHVAAVDPSKPHSVYLIVQYVDITQVEGVARRADEDPAAGPVPPRLELGG